MECEGGRGGTALGGPMLKLGPYMSTPASYCCAGVDMNPVRVGVPPCEWIMPEGDGCDISGICIGGVEDGTNDGYPGGLALDGTRAPVNCVPG